MSNWKTTKLNGKIYVKHGFPFQSEYFQETGDYVVLTPGNFFEEGGFKRNAEKDKCYSHTFPSEYLLEEGDLLVAMTEQAEGLLGSTAKIPYNDKFLHNQRLGLITATDDEIDLDFIYHLFKTKSVRKQIRLTSSGSKVKHTSPDRIYDLQVLIPDSKADQKKIAKFLSTLDAKIELNNRINEELEAMTRLLYDYWFVQFDFPITAEQAAALGKPELEGKPYKTSGGKMVYDNGIKREIPDSWRCGTIDQLGEVMGGSTPSKENDDNFCKEGIPWITPKDLSDNKDRKFIQCGAVDITDKGKNAASLKLLPEGTVLLSSRAPIGYTAIASNPVTTNQGFKSLIPNRGFGSDFIYQTLNRFMKLIEQNASGSTFKEISGGTLKSLKLPIPPIELEQFYRAKAISTSKQQETLEKQNQELTALRDWLLPMLMNGQVTVNE
jgi:type I restriction enzyme, S subunit